MSAPATILVVEDDPDVRETVRDILQDEGFQVAIARNGVEAMACLDSVRPDLILSDVLMPEMDGHQLYREVRARPEWLATPFVFLTALGQSEDIRRAKLLGADDYLVKPLLPEDLVVAVKALLERRARLEEAREEQIRRVKDAILTTVGHEFRTALTYVSGHADLLSGSAGELGPDQLRRSVEGITRGADRLRRLADDLAFLVDLRSGEAQRAFEKSRREIGEIGEVLHQALAGQREFASARSVTLVDRVEEPLPPVLGDPRLLGDAVARLVENGIKFSKREGGKVVLSASGGDGILRVRVTDQGVGIAAEELARIADVFYQADRAHLEQQGAGCGLTIARGIVMMHGGKLTVESVPGTGTTCTVELPLLTGQPRGRPRS